MRNKRTVEAKKNLGCIFFFLFPWVSLRNSRTIFEQRAKDKHFKPDDTTPTLAKECFFSFLLFWSE